MGKLWVIGIGPGSYEDMTIRAASALEECGTIVGYGVYLDLLRDRFPGKNYISTGMGREIERCRIAYEKAMAGEKTALVCSGDAGVYGMAGPALALRKDYPGIEPEIIPGVTSALSGAALLGAPLMQDFCLISLSDLMTDIRIIKKRLLLAAEADFVIVLYNPSSRNRADYLRRAADLILTKKDPSTPCGIARQIGREGESFRLMTLSELRDSETDMFSTVFIGSGSSVIDKSRMLTDRGYKIHEDGKDSL